MVQEKGWVDPVRLLCQHREPRGLLWLGSGNELEDEVWRCYSRVHDGDTLSSMETWGNAMDGGVICPIPEMCLAPTIWFYASRSPPLEALSVPSSFGFGEPLQEPPRVLYLGLLPQCTYFF